MDKKKKSVLSRRGYVIRKEKYSPRLIQKIRKDLTVKPYAPQMFNQNTPSFPIYLESVKKLYIPKYYGLKEIGEPDESNISDGEEMNVIFNGNLRDEQIPVADKFIKAAEETGGGIISVPCGFGKCLGKDTPVMLLNGSIEMVQNITTNHYLMGDDSLPRKVLSITQGVDKMYRVNQDYGDSYICNSAHILSLIKINSDNETFIITDINILDYCNLDNNEKNKYYGYKTSVEYKFIKTDDDPYKFGKQIGYMLEKDIPEYLELDLLKTYVYNYSSVRLEFLAGIIDSIGYLDNNMIIIPNLNCFRQEIKLLINSLGFFVTNNENGLMIKNQYNIPCRIIKLSKNYAKIPFLFYKIHIEYVGIDSYYGFEIDCNRRFLLGDFTVTHNTILGIYLSCKLARKTLVVVHKEFLLNQWKERIEQFCPEAKLGLIKQNKVNIEGKDIVLAMLQSISMKDYPDNTFDSFGFVIVDECHHLAAEVFSRALPKISTKYMLGLSATPNRKDKLDKVFEWYLGDFVYKNTKREKDLVNVEIIEYDNPDKKNYGKVETFFNGRQEVNCISKMITNICLFAPRTKLIIDRLIGLINEERKILILSDRREHLKIMKEDIDNLEICSTGYYVGGSKQQELKESEEKDVILGTYSMACLSDTTNIIDPISGKEYQLGDLEKVKINTISYNEKLNNFEIEESNRFGYTKDKDCYRIEYDLGILELSFDHKVYTNKGWLAVKDLTLDTKLVYSRNIDYQGIHNSNITKNDLINISEEIIRNIDNIDYCINESIIKISNEQISLIISRLIQQLEYPFKIKSSKLRNQLVFIFKRLDILIHSLKDELIIVSNMDNQLLTKEITMYKIPSNIIKIYSDFVDNIGYCKLNKISKINNIRLCDIEIPNNHSFIVENILVHNSEGMDIPKLNTIILSSPKTDVEQSVGRILRQKKKDRKMNPLIIDIIDQFCKSFISQGKKRITFYRKNSYIIDVKKPLLNDNIPENKTDDSETFNFGKCLIDD